MKRAFLLFVVAIIFYCNPLWGEETDPLVWKKHIGGEISTVKFSPDGQYIYVLSKGFKPMKLLTENGDILREYEGFKLTYNTYSENMDISNDGRRLFAADTGNTIHVWDTETGELIKTLDAGYEPWNIPDCMALTVSERYIAVYVWYRIYDSQISESISAIHIWDVNTYEKITTFTPQAPTKLHTIKFSDDGRFLAITYVPFTNDVESETGTILYNSGTWDTYGAFWGHKDMSVTKYVAFSPDGTMMATCSDSYQVKIWDIAERRLITDISTRWYHAESVIFTENSHVFSGNGIWTYNRLDGWELPAKKAVFLYDGIRPTSIDYNPVIDKICGARLRDMVLLKPINTTSIYEPFKQSLTASPNPGTNSIKISFNLPKSGLTNVEISDVNSRIIRKLHTGFLESGQHSFDWDTKAIPTGVYFCKISSKEFNESVKIIVEK
ncbi:MAG: T9SS type A sorting domain-containing protein [Candidatus Kapabacteria bacterium]|nr:T9SS type A sorting domain-containing protein [Candidatus Kapabacteria bacterium]